MLNPVKVSLFRVKAGGRYVYKAAWWGLKDGRRCRLTKTIGPVAVYTRKAAKLDCTRLQAEMNAGRVSIDRMRRVSLADFLKSDLETAALDLKGTSIRTLATAGTHAAKALGGDFNIQKIDGAAVVRIKQYLKSLGLTNASVAKNLSYLQGAFRRGITQGVLHKNPFSGVKLAKWQNPPPTPYKPREVEALYTACQDLWWESFVRLGITSGLRRGELVHLRWASIDFEQGTVIVEPQRAKTFEVDGQSYPLMAWESKDYETRAIPIPPETLGVLGRLKVKSDASPYVFIGLDRLKIIGRRRDKGDTFRPVPNLPRDFAVILCRAKKAIGVEWGQGHRIKDMRSTFGTETSRIVTMFELKELMGHSTIKTTETYYVAAHDDLRERMQAGWKKAATA